MNLNILAQNVVKVIRLYRFHHAQRIGVRRRAPEGPGWRPTGSSVAMPCWAAPVRGPGNIAVASARALGARHLMEVLDAATVPTQTGLTRTMGRCGLRRATSLKPALSYMDFAPNHMESSLERVGLSTG